MKTFLQQHADHVIGHLSGWDRLRFRGTLRMLAHVTGLGRFLTYTGRFFKDFKRHAPQLSSQVREASRAVAESAGRPLIHLNNPLVSKEDQARSIAQRDGVTGGLICTLTATEPCWSYDIRSNHQTGRLDLVRAYRKCQYIYHYQIHPVFGFMHLRLQTWLPFNVWVCINGREWLSRQMDAAGIDYRRCDNCFTWVCDVPAAQKLLDQQVRFDCAGALGKLAAVANPALRQIVGDYDIHYYWSLDESEWATDVMFRSQRQLRELYPALIRHGIETFGSQDVMRFLGRRVEAGITPRFAGEVLSDLRNRPEAVRIKHRVNRNSVKLYDKAGSVLRVETTLNNMRDLRSLRVVNGKRLWKRMRKGVADIPRRAQVSQASNRRYLQALAAVNTPTPLKTLTDKLSRPAKLKTQRVRGLNLLGEHDSGLLETVGRGEFLISGFRNRDLQAFLFKDATEDPAEKRRRTGQITRKLRMLRAHGLIKKVQHTHRYLVSDKGRRVIAALHAAREADIEKLTKAA